MKILMITAHKYTEKRLDAESNERTPAITVPPLYEEIYMDACVFMYNLHILDKITLQVSRNVHIRIKDTSTHIIMDKEHNKTTHTIQL